MFAPLLMAVAFTFGSLQWQTPPGWEPQYPPPESGDEVLFQPLRRDGQNVSVSHYTFKAGSSLADEARDVAQTETDDGRTVKRITHGATCRGTLPSVEIQTAFGSMVSQIYHVTVVGDRVYVLVYTYAPNAPVNPVVRRALDSICPAAAPT